MAASCKLLTRRNMDAPGPKISALHKDCKDLLFLGWAETRCPLVGSSSIQSLHHRQDITIFASTLLTQLDSKSDASAFVMTSSLAPECAHPFHHRRRSTLITLGALSFWQSCFPIHKLCPKVRGNATATNVSEVDTNGCS